MNNKIVYKHLDVNGVVFYIGKGSISRAKSRSNRSKQWHDIAREGYSVVIYSENLSNDDALKLETKLILEYQETVINKRIGFRNHIFDFSTISSRFKIDKSSPSGLSNLKNKHIGWKSEKYWLTTLGSATIPVHRIIYMLHNGSIDFNLTVDHIDGDGFNNNPENLRNVSASVNNQNRLRKSREYKTLISWQFIRGNGSGWILKYKNSEGNRVSKYFSDKKYGGKEDSRVACENYKISITNELRLAGYSERVING